MCAVVSAIEDSSSTMKIRKGSDIWFIRSLLSSVKITKVFLLRGSTPPIGNLAFGRSSVKLPTTSAFAFKASLLETR
jgi:hypothetical protein